MKRHFLILILSALVCSACAGKNIAPASAVADTLNTVPAEPLTESQAAESQAAESQAAESQAAESQAAESQTVQPEEGVTVPQTASDTADQKDANPADSKEAIDTHKAEHGSERANTKAGTERTADASDIGSAGTEVMPPHLERTPVQKLLDAGAYQEARDLALLDLREGRATNADAFWEAVEADPLMTRTLDEEVRPHGTNSISALGGGSTVSFKYKDSADESAKAALKPDQDLRQTMYRSGIAYYRLCQILGCSFDTPVTRPVRFSKADFNTLYNASDSSKNKGYRSKFEHLIWATENGTKYMYAGYKEWISPFDGFPIEVTSVWSPYLQNPDAKLPELSDFLRSILKGARPDAPKPVSKLVEYAGELTTRDILHQISDIILVDYLTNNWDRFSGDVNNYGANCHFQPGGIIAIDNDAAFPPWHAPRVVRRLNLVQMFSRDMVQNLRVLDPDQLLLHLFPNPTKEELKSFERFKERRLDALKYIDGLIAKKGEDRVLVF